MIISLILWCYIISVLSCHINVSVQLLATWQSWEEKDHSADTTTAKLLMEIMKKVLNLDNDIFME